MRTPRHLIAISIFCLCVGATGALAQPTAFTYQGRLTDGTPPVPPGVITEPASSMTTSSAVLNGFANPNGVAATGWFRYARVNPGTCNDSFGTRAPASGGSALGSGTTAMSYSTPITGLFPSTIYYFCAVAQNADGTSFGNVLSFTTGATPITNSGFTYQGRLTNNMAAASGSHDIQFDLFDAATGGTLLASQGIANVAVANGIFTVQLDFGSGVFDGSERWLQVTVGTTPLSPRQRILSQPYAVRAENAAYLGGVPAGNFIQEGDTRLTNDRNPAPGSGNYIQNSQITLGPQNSSFNITGNGTIGGSLTVDTNTLFVDATNNRIGIGTLTPTSILSLNGNSQQTFGMRRNESGNSTGRDFIVTAGGATAGATAMNLAGGNLILQSGVATGNASSNIFFQTPSQSNPGNADNSVTTKMTITGVTGNVGIGTTSPSFLLSLNGNNPRVFGMERSGATNGFGLTIQAGGAPVDGLDRVGGSLNLRSGISTGTGASSILFQTPTPGASGTADNTPSTKMTITGAGNVGIGHSVPTERLHVAGNGLFTGNLTVNGTINGNVARTSVITDVTNLTPNVTGLTFLVLNYASGTANSRVVSDFTGGVDGQCLTVLTLNNRPTITDGGNFDISAAWSPTGNDTLTLCQSSASGVAMWYEVGRSSN